MVGDYGRDNRQAQSGPALLGRKVGLEYPRAQARIDPRPIVRNLQGYNSRTLRKSRDQLESRFGAVECRAGGSRNPVVDQIDDRPFERITIERDSWQGWIQLERKLNLIVAFAEERGHFLRKRIQISRDQGQLRHPRKRREFVNQMLEAFDLANNRSSAFFD